MKARAAGILLGFAALICAALYLDAASLADASRYALDHPLGLLAAFGAYTGAFILRALAWRSLMPERVPLPRLFSLIMAALFLNHAAPAKAGDFARMYGVAQRGVEGGRAAASVILARLADLIGLLAVLAGAWTLADGAGWEPLAAPAAVVAVATLALPLLARARLPSRLGRISGPVAKLQAALRETDPRAIGVALLWATPAWMLEAGVLLFVVRGLGLEVSLAGVVAATCFAVLLQAVPVTPGGLGTYEAGMVFVLVALGAPPGPAFAAAVASHALKFMYAFAAAPFALMEGVAVARARKGPQPEKVKTDEASVEV